MQVTKLRRHPCSSRARRASSFQRRRKKQTQPRTRRVIAASGEEVCLLVAAHLPHLRQGAVVGKTHRPWLIKPKYYVCQSAKNRNRNQSQNPSSEHYSKLTKLSSFILDFLSFNYNMQVNFRYQQQTANSFSPTLPPSPQEPPPRLALQPRPPSISRMTQLASAPESSSLRPR